MPLFCFRDCPNRPLIYQANNTPATPVIDEERPAPRGAKQALALCNTAGEVTTADLILQSR